MFFLVVMQGKETFIQNIYITNTYRKNGDLKTMKSITKISLFILLFAFLATSCVTPRKVNYLQDMYNGSQIELENRFEAVISPYDEINIYVSCHHNPEMAAPFNIFGSTTNATNNTNTRQGYLVDVNGNIQFPVIGSLHVAGLTRLQLQDTITKRLIDGDLIKDPYVMVRFHTFKIFFLGSNGGKAISIPNERCTFLEALALSGDLNQFTNRSEIAVLREVNGRMTMRYLDPRSSDVFNDPYFMLQQNDFIITTGFTGTARNEISYWFTWITSITSIASLVISLMLYNKMGTK